MNYTVSTTHNITIQDRINLYDEHFFYTYQIDNLTVVVNDITESLKVNSYDCNKTKYKNGIVSMFNYFKDIQNNFDTITKDINFLDIVGE